MTFASVRSRMLFENVCSKAFLPSEVLTRNLTEKMFVRVEPTPLVPATSLSSSSLKLEPAFRLLKIISGTHSSYSACLTTGIPPLSQTLTMPLPGSTVTRNSSSFGLRRCSSTALETISSKIFIRAGLYETFRIENFSSSPRSGMSSSRGLMDPQYMPGLRRTCSMSESLRYFCSIDLTSGFVTSAPVVSYWPL